MDLIKFGSYVPPAPTEYDLELIDMDAPDSGRGEDGYMVRERVRASAYKLALSFTNITDGELAAIKAAISPQEISVYLFDGNTVNAMMYAGNRKVKLKFTDTSGTSYWDLSFSLTEY